MIRVSSLFFRHEGGREDALSDVTFSVDKGQVCAVLGMNGSGKSSLLQILAGILVPASGTLIWEKQNTDAAQPGSGKKIYLPQNPDVFILGSMVREDLVLGMDVKDSRGINRALDAARRFGLFELLDAPVHVLSYGQKRALCLASAVALEPDLLLLDEPFAGLDYPSSKALRDIIRQNKSAGLTQFVTGHDLDFFADLADMFVLLHKGRLVAAGGAGEVFPHLESNGVRPPC